jgi:lactoylglutathione lyase
LFICHRHPRAGALFWRRSVFAFTGLVAAIQHAFNGRRIGLVPGNQKERDGTMATYTWDHIEKMLGAEIIRSTANGKPRIDMKLGGANIFIAPVAPGEVVNAAPVTPYQGLDHFGLRVSGIDAIAADLKKKGVEFTKEPHSPRPGIKICFLRGPQGISIELLDRDPKYV